MRWTDWRRKSVVFENFMLLEGEILDIPRKIVGRRTSLDHLTEDNFFRKRQLRYILFDTKANSLYSAAQKLHLSLSMETISRYQIFKSSAAKISSSIQISFFRDMLEDVLQADSS